MGWSPGADPNNGSVVSLQALNTTTNTPAGGSAEIDLIGHAQNNSEVEMIAANVGAGGGILFDMYLNGAAGVGQLYIGATNGSAPVILLNVHGDGTGRQIGFFGATPISQPAAIGAPSGGTTVDTQARAAIVSLINLLSAAAAGYGLTA